MRILLVVLVGCLMGGCVAPVVPSTGTVDACEPPAASQWGTTCDGPSAFWGAGPNAYAGRQANDAVTTEWHSDGATPGTGMRTRYELVEGTMHSAGKVLCIVADDGARVFEQ